jgi:Fe(3+) dicitrate transport protein
LNKRKLYLDVFSNIALTDSQYLKSDAPNIEGNKVEFVPLLTLRQERDWYKNFMSSLQLTYVSTITEASNSKIDTNDNTYGYLEKSLLCSRFFSLIQMEKLKLEAGVTNFTNNSYFTRRATGYPGPGIIPSDTRTFYTTLEFVF